MLTGMATKKSIDRLATVKDMYAHLLAYNEIKDADNATDEILIIRDLAESSRDDNGRKVKYANACQDLMDACRRLIQCEPFGDWRDELDSYGVLLRAIHEVDKAL